MVLIRPPYYCHRGEPTPGHTRGGKQSHATLVWMLTPTPDMAASNGLQSRKALVGSLRDVMITSRSTVKGLVVQTIATRASVGRARTQKTWRWIRAKSSKIRVYSFNDQFDSSDYPELHVPFIDQRCIYWIISYVSYERTGRSCLRVLQNRRFQDRIFKNVTYMFVHRQTRVNQNAVHTQCVLL